MKTNQQIRHFYFSDYLYLDFNLNSKDKRSKNPYNEKHSNLRLWPQDKENC